MKKLALVLSLSLRMCASMQPAYMGNNTTLMDRYQAWEATQDAQRPGYASRMSNGDYVYFPARTY
jgi:hypothetical protein